MTVQEAYNKGLDVAENEALEKFSKALEGVDVGSFNNPKMEELRQKLLFFEPPKQEFEKLDTNYVSEILLGKKVDRSNFNILDSKVVEILEYVISLVGTKSRSRISYRIKQLLTDLRVDFINSGGKLR